MVKPSHGVEASAAAGLRAEVRRWLVAHRDVGPGRAFREAVIDAGWAVPSWPPEWFGRGLPMSLSQIVLEEFASFGAPGAGQDATNLWANTVIAFGNDEMKRRLLRPLLLDELSMCLLYSEPGAGSDLAAVQTRAERDGDEWVVNGQKVWTSGAREADYGMLIARTDWNVPKHRGISFFFLPMKQEGIEVRPIRQATGDARFNEVFITDARVPDVNRVGPVNDGWKVLQTALMYERMVLSRSLGGGRPRSGSSNPRDGERSRGGWTVETGTVDGRTDARGGPAAPTRPSSDRPAEVSGYQPPDTSLIGLARSCGRHMDPLIRQGLAHLYSLRAVNTWNGMRSRAELKQGSSSPAASLGKLAMSRILHTAAHLEGLILGMRACLEGPGFPRVQAHNYSQLNAYFTSIGGGTDQIQRNIIGERILGLPREPEVDKDLPFKDVAKSPAGAR